jgi:hypothetical protein
VELQPRTGVGEQGKAEGVGFGKAVGGKGDGRVSDFADDLLITARAAQGGGEFREGALEAAVV